MRKVAKAAAVALMTPLTVAVIAVGESGPANAEDSCWYGLASASITPPSGSITAGSSVHVSAKVSGMLAGAHLQISGPGLDRQIGPTVHDGTISGDVAVQEDGYFVLKVIGNLTTCTYDTSGFSVNARSTSPKPKPTHHKTTPSKTPKSGGYPTVPGSGPTLPSGTGTGTGGVPTQPLGNNSPFSLPSLGPGGSGVGFQYPTPDPQIAAPNTKQVRADNVSATTPIKWGQSVAAALVLLLLSAHFGMWSRRQRLAAEARAAQTGPGGRTGRAGGKSSRGGTPTVRRRRRAPVTELATTGAGTAEAADDARDAGTGDSKTAASVVEAAAGPRQKADGAAVAEDRAGDHQKAGEAREESSADVGHREAAPARRGYRGRRRRS
ncbi:hypothetical protein GCM10023196_067570 [Actinoallomurus vinaceus]|uniref:Uncharacterized protein n=1 Tax=Actinoallomurus vinaceus TaxID=1080074 RepID=A0ABP8UKP9_9ACTN